MGKEQKILLTLKSQMILLFQTVPVRDAHQAPCYNQQGKEVDSSTFGQSAEAEVSICISSSKLTVPVDEQVAYEYARLAGAGEHLADVMIRAIFKPLATVTSKPSRSLGRIKLVSFKNTQAIGNFE